MIPESCLIITFPPWALVVIGAILATLGFWFTYKYLNLPVHDLRWIAAMPTSIIGVAGCWIFLFGIAPYIPCIQFAVGGI